MRDGGRLENRDMPPPHALSPRLFWRGVVGRSPSLCHGADVPSGRSPQRGVFVAFQTGFRWERRVLLAMGFSSLDVQR